MDGLAACTAGLAGGVVEVGDGDGADTNGGTVLGDCGGDGGLLGARSETVGCVFYVAAGDDGAVIEEDCSAYAEVTVGGVGVMCDCAGLLLEVSDLGWCEVAGMILGRHEFEAIGCVEGYQVAEANA